MTSLAISTSDLLSCLPVVCCDRETDQNVKDGYSKLASMIRSLMAEFKLHSAGQIF
jgi:hypothetical protein